MAIVSRHLIDVLQNDVCYPKNLMLPMCQETVGLQILIVPQKNL